MNLQEKYKALKETHQTLQKKPIQLSTTIEYEPLSLKEKLLYTSLSLLALGGTIWFGKNMIIKSKANKEENKSFEDGTPATIAKQIRMAFDNDGWWGTNVVLLRTTLTAITSQKDWEAVIKSYQKLYNSNLLKDMSNELQSTEYNEMLQIINAKPVKKGQTSQNNPYSSWAKRLKAAFDKSYGFLPGTDDDSIVVTLNEIPTQKAFIYTGLYYKKLFGTDLMDDLKSEAELTQYSEWLKIITKKKKA